MRLHLDPYGLVPQRLCVPVKLKRPVIEISY